MHTKTDTSHIEACRQAWLKHRSTCQQCDDAVFVNFYLVEVKQPYCSAGQVILDELIASHEAHRDCEHLTGTEATPCAIIKT